MITIQKNSDLIGAVASGLCLIHCLATPILFIAKACSAHCCADTPMWWKAIDYLFLVISFIAIYSATQKTSKYWIKPALWIAWSFLFFVIINEHFRWLILIDEIIYVPAILLVILHLYNIKFCKCVEDKCCVN